MENTPPTGLVITDVIFYGPSNVKVLRVNRCDLDPLTLLPENNPIGHRGLWWYNTDQFPDGKSLEVGDIVVFICCESVVEVGTVQDVLAIQPNTTKYCSASNDKGIRWSDLTGVLYGGDVVIRQMLAPYQLSKGCVDEIIARLGKIMV